jgi:cellulose synthase operon protein C
MGVSVLNRMVRILAVVTLTLNIAACGASSPQEDLEKAIAFRADGKTSAAIIEFKNALQKDPTLAEARLGLGESYLETGELDAAVKELDRARELGIESDRVLPPLLEAKVDLGRRDEVLAELETVELTPRYQAVRGQALLAGGELDRARSDFESALRSDPTLARSYLGLAQLAVAGKPPDFAVAAEVLNRGVKAVASNRRMWLMLGETELNQQHPIEAGRAFDQAKALRGNDFAAELGLTRARLLENKPDEASEIVESVLKRAPKHPLAQHLKGVIALSKEQLDEAETALETTLSVAPDYAPSLLALANVKYRQGERNQAASYLRRYIAQDPEDPGPRKSLARMLLESDDPAGAVEALLPVSEKLTDGPDLTLLGTAYLRAGRLDDATRLLAAAAEAAPDSSEAKTQLALSLAAAGDNAGALAQLHSIPAPGTAPDATLTQADTLRVLVNLRSGNLDAALATANQMVANDATKPLPLHLLAAVQTARKDEAAARSALERALALDPKYAPAAIDLARLDTTQGRTGEARTTLESGIAANPSDVSLLIALAELEYGQQDLDRAQKLLQQARTVSPSSVLSRIVLGRLALERGDIALATEVLAEVARIDADNPQVMLLGAQVSAQTNDTQELGRYLDRLQAYLSAAPADAATLWLPVGELQGRAGRVDLARASLQRSLAGPSADGPTLVALVQLETAAGSLDSARTYLERLKKGGGDAALLLELEGDVEMKAGQPTQAIALYRKAVTAETKSIRASTKLASALVQVGNSGDAVALLEGRLKANSSDDEAARMLATIRMQSGDATAAIRDYEALVARRPEDAVALNNLAWLYFEANDPRAESTARAANAAAPKNPQISDTLGWILVHKNSPGAAGEAVTLLDAAAKGQPGNPSMLYHLAVAQQKAGQQRDAQQSVDRALATESFAERNAALQLARELRER